LTQQLAASRILLEQQTLQTANQKADLEKTISSLTLQIGTISEVNTNL
jgi:hypothetical protein